MCGCTTFRGACAAHQSAQRTASRGRCTCCAALCSPSGASRSGRPCPQQTPAHAKPCLRQLQYDARERYLLKSSHRPPVVNMGTSALSIGNTQGARSGSSKFEADCCHGLYMTGGGQLTISSCMKTLASLAMASFLRFMWALYCASV